MKKLLSVFVFVLTVFSSSAHALDDFMFGVGGASLSIGGGSVMGFAVNAQAKVSDNSAIGAAYYEGGVYGVSYRGYTNDQFFYEIGALNTLGVTGLLLGGGADMKMGENLVLQPRFGLVNVQGFTGFAIALTFNFGA